MVKGKQVSDVECTHQVHSLLYYSYIHHIGFALSPRQYFGQDKNSRWTLLWQKDESFPTGDTDMFSVCLQKQSEQWKMLP